MVDAVLGEIRTFAGDYAPEGWALCRGQSLEVAKYEALYSVIGTTYGGDGRVTFNLPDLRGRVPVGQGHGPGLTARVLGQTGGSSKVSPTLANFPAHRHSLTVSGMEGGMRNPVAGFALAVPKAQSGGTIYAYAPPALGAEQVMADDVITEAPGGQTAQPNLMPFLCISFIIALNGLYPEKKT